MFDKIFLLSSAVNLYANTTFEYKIIAERKKNEFTLKIGLTIYLETNIEKYPRLDFL